MIPKILHFCFGMSPGDRQWSLSHYTCVRSAIERIQPDDVFFYYEYEPSGPWWELTRGLVTLQKISAPREIFGNPLLHPAHRADVVRLQALLRKGGIYLDCDVFVHRSFDDLLTNSAVLGEVRIGQQITGLGNCVMLSEPEAPFLQKWYSHYKSFRSKGQDEYWDEHSVRLPYRLRQQFPDEVTVLPASAFYYPSYDAAGLNAIYKSVANIDASGMYATHLWESLVWDRYLEDLTPGRVRKEDSNFHRWITPMIRGLADDYGAPRLAVRLSRSITRANRRARSNLRLRSRLRGLLFAAPARCETTAEGEG